MLDDLAPCAVKITKLNNSLSRGKRPSEKNYESIGPTFIAIIREPYFFHPFKLKDGISNQTL